MQDIAAWESKQLRGALMSFAWIITRTPRVVLQHWWNTDANVDAFEQFVQLLELIVRKFGVCITKCCAFSSESVLYCIGVLCVFRVVVLFCATQFCATRSIHLCVIDDSVLSFNRGALNMVE